MSGDGLALTGTSITSPVKVVIVLVNCAGGVSGFGSSIRSGVGGGLMSADVIPSNLISSSAVSCFGGGPCCLRCQKARLGGAAGGVGSSGITSGFSDSASGGRG